MLIIVHADRSRPTLKDDERFQNGLVRDLKIRILNSVGKNCRQCLNPHRSQNFTMIYFIETKIRDSTSCSTQFVVRHCLHLDIQINTLNTRYSLLEYKCMTIEYKHGQPICWFGLSIFLVWWSTYTSTNIFNYSLFCWSGGEQTHT